MDEYNRLCAEFDRAHALHAVLNQLEEKFNLSPEERWAASGRRLRVKCRIIDRLWDLEEELNVDARSSLVIKEDNDAMAVGSGVDVPQEITDEPSQLTSSCSDGVVRTEVPNEVQEKLEPDSVTVDDDDDELWFDSPDKFESDLFTDCDTDEDAKTRDDDGDVAVFPPMSPTTAVDAPFQPPTPEKQSHSGAIQLFEDSPEKTKATGCRISVLCYAAPLVHNKVGALPVFNQMPEKDGVRSEMSAEMVPWDPGGGSAHQAIDDELPAETILVYKRMAESSTWCISELAPPAKFAKLSICCCQVVEQEYCGFQPMEKGSKDNHQLFDRKPKWWHLNFNKCLDEASQVNLGQLSILEGFEDNQSKEHMPGSFRAFDGHIELYDDVNHEGGSWDIGNKWLHVSIEIVMFENIVERNMMQEMDNLVTVDATPLPQFIVLFDLHLREAEKRIPEISSNIKNGLPSDRLFCCFWNLVWSEGEMVTKTPLPWAVYVSGFKGGGKTMRSQTEYRE